MLNECAKSDPLEAKLYGGRTPFWKRSRFRHRTRGDDENIANGLGVPRTFYQDCSSGRVSNVLCGSCHLGSIPLSPPGLSYYSCTGMCRCIGFGFQILVHTTGYKQGIIIY